MRAIDGRSWLVLPALLLLAVAFLAPVGWLLSRAFTFPEPGLQNFALLWERPVYMRVMMNTLVISAIVTPVTVLLAFPVAHLMAHGSARLRRWLGGKSEGRFRTNHPARSAPSASPLSSILSPRAARRGRGGVALLASLAAPD